VGEFLFYDADSIVVCGAVADQEDFEELVEAAVAHADAIPAEAEDMATGFEELVAEGFFLGPVGGTLDVLLGSFLADGVVELFDLGGGIGGVKEDEVGLDVLVHQHLQEVENVHVVLGGGIGVEVVGVGSPLFITGERVDANGGLGQVPFDQLFNGCAREGIAGGPGPDSLDNHG